MVGTVEVIRLDPKAARGCGMAAALPWTPLEEGLLRDLWPRPIPIELIVGLIGRTVGGLQDKAKRMGLQRATLPQARKVVKLHKEIEYSIDTGKFVALVGSDPKELSELSSRGCHWPVEASEWDEGPIRFCNMRRDIGQSYCPVHKKLSLSKGRGR
jgi:hypothetical protein